VLTKHVRVAIDGRLGRVTLDRPGAINALNQAMIEEIGFALDRLEADDTVTTVVLDGAGDRGFCAGGDVVALRNSALDGGATARRFWRDEYRLDARIAAYPKPVVAFMDGVVMGGGVGLAAHATYRVATERLIWAMPEVRIGFAPDVGATFLLSRLGGEVGTWLALTAHRADRKLALGLGLVDLVVSAAHLEDVLEVLAIEDPGEGLRSFGLGDQAEVCGSARIRELTEGCFAADDVAVIEERLALDGSAEAHAALGQMRLGSPTSLRVTLAALRKARDIPTLEGCLEQEFRTSCSFLGVDDFCEGIRAVLVDKDGQPRWSPASPAEVDDRVVERILEGPSDLAPLWNGDDRGRGNAWMYVC